MGIVTHSCRYNSSSIFLTKSTLKDNKYNKFNDYLRVVNAFISKYDAGWNKNLDSVNNKKNKLPIFNRGLNLFYDLKDLTLLNANEYNVLDLLFKYNTKVYIKPPNDEIINLGKPYII